MVWRETIVDGKLWYGVRQLMYTQHFMVWCETIVDGSLWCGVKQLNTAVYVQKCLLHSVRQLM